MAAQVPDRGAGFLIRCCVTELEKPMAAGPATVGINGDAAHQLFESATPMRTVRAIAIALGTEHRFWNEVSCAIGRLSHFAAPPLPFIRATGPRRRRLASPAKTAGVSPPPRHRWRRARSDPDTVDRKRKKLEKKQISTTNT